MSRELSTDTVGSSAAHIRKHGGVVRGTSISAEYSLILAVSGFGPSMFTREPIWATPSLNEMTGYPRAAMSGRAEVLSVSSSGV